jgi:guanylate kinase
LIVVSGPSGVGKSSVVEGLARLHPFSFSVSMTTRAARPGEVDGVDYLFVDETEFDQAVADGRLVEWAEYGGHMYGTPARAIEEELAGGRDVLLDIEIVGSRIIHDRYPDAVMVFIAPPDLRELERRLRSRGDTSEAEVAARLAVATEQMEAAGEFFDFFVVNDDLGAAIGEVGDILASVPEPSD